MSMLDPSNDATPCPYCKEDMFADYVDVGVGFVQCGPYHCQHCGASEIGPEMNEWIYKDRKGNDLCLPGKRRYNNYTGKKQHPVEDWSKPAIKPNAPFTKEELDTGFYKGKISPYANTVNGTLVDHKTAHGAYRLGILDEKDLPND